MQRIKWPVLSALTALLLTAGVVYAQTFPVFPAGWLQAQRLSVRTTSTLTGDVTTGADLTVGDALTAVDVTASDDLVVTDDATVGSHMLFTPQTVVTVTNGSTITPTGGLQYLASPANRGTRLVATTTVAAGTVQMFYNSGSFTITLTDTAPLLLDGNVVLEPKNTLVLFHNGTSWVELSRADAHVP